jgi:hypothetical protein
MDALDTTSGLPLLLLLDPSYFELFLRWSQGVGFKELSHFFLETDTKRSLHSVHLEKGCPGKQKRDSRGPSNVQVIYDHFFRRKGDVAGLLPSHASDKFAKLAGYRIPLHAAFASSSEKVWMELIKLGKRLPESEECWRYIRSQVVGNFKISLVKVLHSDLLRKYFEEYLQVFSPSDKSALNCWMDVKNLLLTLRTFKVPGQKLHFLDVKHAFFVILTSMRKMYDLYFLERKRTPIVMQLEQLLDSTEGIESEVDLEFLDFGLMQDFIFRCERLLNMIQEKMLGYLSTKQTHFFASDQYAFMVAHVRAMDSPHVRAYISLLLFLFNKVRREGEVGWREPEAQGRSYIR